MNKILFFVLANCITSFGAVRYVDAENGDDSGTGSSPGSPWLSLDKVNGTLFQPGDTILLKAGSRWIGQLAPRGSGMENMPIVVDKYGGDSLPCIDGNGMTGEGVLRLFNQAYWEISNLELTNNASQQGDRRGAEVLASNHGQVNHIYLRNLHVHHIMGLEGHGNTEKRTGGIYIALQDDSGQDTRFNDILIENCHIHHNFNQGIVTNSETSLGGYPGDSGWMKKRFSNLRIRGNRIHHISKNAIIIRMCDNTCVIEYNVCYETAMSTEALTGVPASPDMRHGNTIFSRSSLGTVFQFNEGYFNRGDAYDGSLYDADLDSPGCIFQYSYSHDNAQGLFWICTTPRDSGVICRYNISQNDKGIIICPNYPGTSVYIYNNIIYVGEDTSPKIIDERRPADKTYYFTNNIIYNMSTSAGYSWHEGANRHIQNNLYFGIHPDSEPDDPDKMTMDPMFVNPGQGGIGFETLNGYMISKGSPCTNAGLSLPRQGTRDFQGTQLDGFPDLGAFEFQELTMTVSEFAGKPAVDWFSYSPADGMVSVRSAGSIVSMIKVFDIQGKQVLSTSCVSETCTLNTTGIAAGPYFGKMSSGGDTRIEKIYVR